MPSITHKHIQGTQIPAWVSTQQKTFTRWVNSHLATQSIPPLEDLATDLSSGVHLIELLEIIGGEPLGRYYRKPRLRVQKAENINVALEFIKRRGVQLYNIGAEDIMDGNLKLILGLLWVLVLRFTISGIKEEGLSAKEGLLQWVQRKTAGYAGVDVRDFSTSWADGKAFMALLEAHRPDLVQYGQDSGNNKKDHRKTTARVFDIAEREIGIPQLLDVEDVCDVQKPDERSVMAYVAHWFHAFSALDKIETSSRRLEKFVHVAGTALEMRHAYEARVKVLMAAMVQHQNVWKTAELSGVYAEAKEQRIALTTYKCTTKREWATEKSELVNLLGNIRTKLATYKLKSYSPPAGLGLNDLEKAWHALVSREIEHARLINQQLAQIKERLKRRFADTANSVSDALHSVAVRLSQLDGELQGQLVGVSELSDLLKPIGETLCELRDLDRQCVDANIGDENNYTVYSYDELEYEHGLLKASLVTKLAFLENQMVARSMTNLTALQLEEFESAFRFFDKTQQNGLNETEFAGALASLGLVYTDGECQGMFELACMDGGSTDDISGSGFCARSDSSSGQEASVQSLEAQTCALGLSADDDAQSQRPDSSSSRSSSRTATPPSLPHTFSSPYRRNSWAATASTSVADQQPRISFEGFIKFMIKATEDQHTTEQVLQSFADIAGGKRYVTELDLRNSLVPEATIAKLVKYMPPEPVMDGGYNYVKYMRLLTTDFSVAKMI